ncbi:hypothetical protein [Streptomyces sp. LUP47B]|uniref:hypothetical protein n=1 Tax=Streptomyces sp. LUP47B TaxID=1890286 RepID=UPI0008520D4F|nr:hypothetical protein [Streptomyces sp. LUP47B]
MSQGRHRATRPATAPLRRLSRLRRIAAGLSLAAAAATGTALAADLITGPPDTTWGAPDTANDTTWGTPPIDTTPIVQPVTDTVGNLLTPLDTTWG